MKHKIKIVKSKFWVHLKLFDFKYFIGQKKEYILFEIWIWQTISLHLKIKRETLFEMPCSNLKCSCKKISFWWWVYFKIHRINNDISDDARSVRKKVGCQRRISIWLVTENSRRASLNNTSRMSQRRSSVCRWHFLHNFWWCVHTATLEQLSIMPTSLRISCQLRPPNQ